jgi:hypothetical protein
MMAVIGFVILVTMPIVTFLLEIWWQWRYARIVIRVKDDDYVGIDTYNIRDKNVIIRDERGGDADG